MYKISDYCREIECLSAQTGLSMTYILERLDANENELAEISMVTGIPYTYVCRKFVTSGFDMAAVKPTIIKSDYAENSRVSLMGKLADQLIKNEISTEEYFHRLGELKEGRSA